jgi:hypothetical protein
MRFPQSPEREAVLMDGFLFLGRGNLRNQQTEGRI